MKTGSTQPVYLLAGGPGSRRKKDPALQAALEACGHRNPAVAYIGTASGDDASFLDFIGRRLLEAGAGTVDLAPLADHHRNLTRAKAIIERADLVFFSGGDVEEGMRQLDAAGMTGLLRELHRRGVAFCGVSAGSIMLAKQWVRWSDPDDETTAAIFPCAGIAPVLCDTHAEEDDWSELKALLQLCPAGTQGYGIPSGLALRAMPDGTVEALGGPVPVFAYRGAEIVCLADIAPL